MKAFSINKGPEEITFDRSGYQDKRLKIPHFTKEHGENTLVETTNKLVSTANIFIPGNLQKMFRATPKSVVMNCKMGWLNQFSFKQHDVRYLNRRRKAFSGNVNPQFSDQQPVCCRDKIIFLRVPSKI